MIFLFSPTRTSINFSFDPNVPFFLNFSGSVHCMDSVYQPSRNLSFRLINIRMRAEQRFVPVACGDINKVKALSNYLSQLDQDIPDI